MNLQQQVKEAIKEAMLSKDAVKLETVRSIDTAFSKAITSKDRKKSFDDTEGIKILVTLTKQRQEAADLYTQGGRAELAFKELAELAILKTYLPSEISEVDLKASINGYIQSHPEAKMGEIIKAMKEGAETNNVIVDGKMLAKLVKEAL